MGSLRSADGDECYELGGPKQFPDIAIEVVWTSGGLDKLDIYLGFVVREVWIWRDGRIEVQALRSANYERIVGSELLPGIDLSQLTDFARSESQTQAVRDFRKALSGK